MKVNENKGYGILGKRIELNLMDCYEVTHTAERIRAAIKELDEHEKEQGLTFIEGDIRDILINMNIFLTKIGIEPSQQATIFQQEEEAQEECA